MTTKPEITWIPITPADDDPNGKSGQDYVKETLSYKTVDTSDNCEHCDFYGSYGGVLCCMYYVRSTFVPGHMVFAINKNGHCQNWKRLED